jgi:hypothetical protein
MIDKQFGEIIFICDECGDDFATGYANDEFNQAVYDMKSEGWITVKDGDDWKHICSTCTGANDEKST